MLHPLVGVEFEQSGDLAHLWIVEEICRQSQWPPPGGLVPQSPPERQIHQVLDIAVILEGAIEIGEVDQGRILIADFPDALPRFNEPLVDGIELIPVAELRLLLFEPLPLHHRRFEK